MKLLAFCLLLGMSAQGQTPKIDTNVSVNTFIGCAEGITISIATRTGKSDVIAECHDGYYERVAADETGPLGDGPNPPWPDGKILWIDPKGEPHKPWDEVDGMCGGYPCVIFAQDARINKSRAGPGGCPSRAGRRASWIRRLWSIGLFRSLGDGLHLRRQIARAPHFGRREETLH